MYHFSQPLSHLKIIGTVWRTRASTGGITEITVGLWMLVWVRSKTPENCPSTPNSLITRTVNTERLLVRYRVLLLIVELVCRDDFEIVRIRYGILCDTLSTLSDGLATLSCKDLIEATTKVVRRSPTIVTCSLSGPEKSPDLAVSASSRVFST